MIPEWTAPWDSLVCWHITGSNTFILFVSRSHAYKDQCPDREHGSIICKSLTVSWSFVIIHYLSCGNRWNGGPHVGWAVTLTSRQCSTLLPRWCPRNSSLIWSLCPLSFTRSWPWLITLSKLPITPELTHCSFTTIMNMYLLWNLVVIGDATVVDRSYKHCTWACLLLGEGVQWHQMSLCLFPVVWQIPSIVEAPSALSTKVLHA